jgi:pterin-4a-carbinolamine dehydratase
MGSSTAAQRYATLTVEALADALRSLPGWTLEQGHLVRRVAVRDPWRLLERVSQVELELDHHSVVALDRGQLVFSVWTHVRPGLTPSTSSWPTASTRWPRADPTSGSAQAGSSPRRTLSPSGPGRRRRARG